tara:strand:- start:638 stop:1114 length:477 start_codon:yes stop_codon:yes gene_type:complete
MSGDIGYVIERYIESEIQDALDNIDIHSLVDNCIDEYDFSSVVSDAIADHDFTDDVQHVVNDCVQCVLEDCISSSEAVYDMIHNMFESLGNEGILRMLKKGIEKSQCEVADLKKMNQDLRAQLRDLSMEEINSRAPEVALETVNRIEIELNDTKGEDG